MCFFSFSFFFCTLHRYVHAAGSVQRTAVIATHGCCPRDALPSVRLCLLLERCPFLESFPRALFLRGVYMYIQSLTLCIMYCERDFLPWPNDLISWPATMPNDTKYWGNVGDPASRERGRTSLLIISSRRWTRWSGVLSKIPRRASHCEACSGMAVS